MQKNDLYKINKPEIGLLGVSAGAFAVVLVAVLLIIAIGYVRLVIGRGIMARVRGMV